MFEDAISVGSHPDVKIISLIPSSSFIFDKGNNSKLVS